MQVCSAVVLSHPGATTRPEFFLLHLRVLSPQFRFLSLHQSKDDLK